MVGGQDIILPHASPAPTMTSSNEQPGPAVVTLGMFIVDTFESYDAHGVPVGPDVPPQGSMAVPFSAYPRRE
jgi:hypothetical protein